jgi:hypothetical protein
MLKNPRKRRIYYKVLLLLQKLCRVNRHATVCAVLTDSKDATACWRKLIQRLKAEGNETVTYCHALKLRAADGKMRLTDVADTEQLE